MKFNKTWHGKNKMTENPSLKERIKWHLAHSENCSCRPIPKKLLKEIEKTKDKTQQ